jgi:hypothetical protein
MLPYDFCCYMVDNECREKWFGDINGTPQACTKMMKKD